jgi:VWFA-related protein
MADRYLLALVVAAVMIHSPGAQPPPGGQAPRPADAPPTFRAGVELVRLDVQVTDRNDRPISDLRQDEVEVLEEGNPRPIVFFQHVEEPAESYADIARHTIAGEVSTNQGAPRGHLYVIIFDQRHIMPGNEQRTRLAVERFVSTRLKPGDRVALYAVPGPGPQIGLTADTHRVSTALAQVQGSAEPQTIGAVATMTEQEAFEIIRGNELILQHVAGRVQAESVSDTERRAGLTVMTGTLPLTDLVKEDARKIANAVDSETRAVLARLADILRSLGAIEGRKTVLLISEGFHGERLPREIEDVAAAAAQSYSVVTAFDVNRHEIDVTAAEPLEADHASTIHDRITPLGSLAAETGGSLVIDAGQHAEQALAAVAGQSQDYYLVGFAPRDGRAKDAYRRVTVRVRRTGAQVGTRTGFTLTDAAARRDRYQSIERALAAPYPQQGLPLRYTTYILRGQAPGAHTVILSLEAELPIASSNTPQMADVVFVVRHAGDGRVAASGRDSLPLPSRHDGGATTGTGIFRVQFDLPAADYLMRAVVREPSGLVGSADRRFTVRALDGPSLEATDLLLSPVRGELPVRPTAYTGDGLSGVLELYARTPAQLQEARVLVELVPVGDTSALVSGTADLSDVRTTARGVTREACLALPLQAVLPGHYLARARVVVGPDTVSQSVREVDIRPGRRPAREGANERETTDREPGFDPRAIAESTIARDFIARLESASSPAVADARLGVDRLRSADFAGSISALESVLQAETRNGSAAFLLGWAYHGAGEDRQAISAWRRAAFVDPTLVSAHLALADIYERLSQPALAGQALRAGVTSPELLDRLARLGQK